MRILIFNVKVNLRQVSTVRLLTALLVFIAIFTFNFLTFAYTSMRKHIVEESQMYAIYKKSQIIYAETIPIQNDWFARVMLIVSILALFMVVWLYAHKVTITRFQKKSV